MDPGFGPDSITRDWHGDPGLNLIRVEDRDEVAAIPVGLAETPNRLIWPGDRRGRYNDK